MILPKRLKKGDTIGFVAPSAGLAKIFKYRVERAIKWFKDQGFKVKLGNYFWEEGYIAGEPEKRAEDLNKMIYDKEVKAIISLIGGEHSIQLVDLIDYKAFRKNPKIFVGFSDITVLHLAFYKKSKVVTFYGPMVLTQFGEYPRPHDYTIKYFYKAVVKGYIGKIEPTRYTDQFLDWNVYKNIPRTEWKKNKFLWLRKGEAEGILLGGCLPSMLRLAGTKYFPKFNNSILFIETPEGKEPGEPYPLEEADANISQLKIMGVFDKIKGLIIGIPYRYTEKMKLEFYKLILERLKEYDFPILANVNFGHTDPIITIPYGVKARISEEGFEIIGRCVK